MIFTQIRMYVPQHHATVEEHARTLQLPMPMVMLRHTYLNALVGMDGRVTLVKRVCSCFHYSPSFIESCAQFLISFHVHSLRIPEVRQDRKVRKIVLSVLRKLGVEN